MNLGNVFLLSSSVNEIDDVCEAIVSSRNIDDLRILYSKVKEFSHLFYSDGVINSYYNSVVRIINKCEQLFNDMYLYDTSFSLKDLCINSCSNEREILEYIVNETRKFLLSFKNDFSDHIKVDFSNYCVIASKKVKEICDGLGIECYILEIYPGFDMAKMLFDGFGFHFLNVIKFDEKYYLFDVTYGQFFKSKDCNLGRIGLMNYFTPKVGAFIDKDNVPYFIKNLIKDGYVLLDDSIFKSYMDMFAVSFRNGLYYDKTKDFSFTTSYSVADYVNFLNGRDSQIRHEGEEVLGFQKRPLL